MKKFYAVLLLIGVVLFGAGQASAYFEAGDLVRVVWDSTTENAVAGPYLRVGGTVSGAAITDNNYSSFYGTSFSGSLAGIDLSTANMAFFMGKKTSGPTTYDVYFASTSATNPGINAGQLTPFITGSNNITSFYGTGSQSVTGKSASDLSSFAKVAGTSNYFGNYAATAGYGSTAGLTGSGDGGYVDMYLYHYLNNVLKPDTATGTDYVAILRTYSNGTTTILAPGGSSPVVPIPAAVWLLGSGLFGIIGIRRRQG